MSVRPIDANALKACFNADVSNHMQSWNTDLLQLLMIDIDEAPTLDYAPVRHGAWKECDWVDYDGRDECVRYSKQGLKCTACFNVFKKQLLWKRNYCPNCGAKMDGGKSNA